MTAVLNLSPEEQQKLRAMDEKFKSEFEADPRFLASGLSLAEFIESRRVDVGISQLMPICFAEMEVPPTDDKPAAPPVSWMASRLDDLPAVAPENPANTINFPPIEILRMP